MFRLAPTFRPAPDGRLCPPRSYTPLPQSPTVILIVKFASSCGIIAWHSGNGDNSPNLEETDRQMGENGAVRNMRS